MTRLTKIEKETIVLYYNKHGTGYGSQPYSIPTRT